MSRPVSLFQGRFADDILLYGAGAGLGRIRHARGDGSFSARATTVTGVYQPLLGNFDGDGATDIFWHGPGSGDDSLWPSNDDGTFRHIDVAVSGAYQPLVGAFD